MNRNSKRRPRNYEVEFASASVNYKQRNLHSSYCIEVEFRCFRCDIETTKMGVANVEQTAEECRARERGTFALFSIRISNVTFVSRQALSSKILKIYLCREELDLEIGKD